MENLRSDCSRLLAVLFVVSQSLFIHTQAFSWVPPSSRCETSPEANTWTGPVPDMPILPLQYSMKVEANILQKNKSVEVEEHYDSVNQRASVSITRNGTTVVSIFNFNTSQRYDIYSNGSCETRPSSSDYLGLVRRGQQNKPVMAPVNDVFRFGKGFNMTYVGKENVRGINVNHWTSCQNWTQFGAAFQLDYYFSDPDYTTATGASQIPIRAVLNGTAINRMSGPNQTMHTFQHSYEFISFRAGPPLNDEVFQIPAGIVCTGRSDNKPLPPIPDQLEISMEVTVPVENQLTWEEYLFYDYNHKLVETITTMVIPEESEDMDKLRSGQMKADNDNLIALSISVVRDYSNGLVYVTEQTNKTCLVKKMSSSTSDLTMAHGQSLLAIANSDRKFMYQGQATVRRLLVDIWAMEQGGVSTELYFLPKVGSHPFQQLVGMFIKNRTAADTVDLPKIFDEVFQSESKLRQELDISNPQQNQRITGDQMSWGLQLEKVLDQHLSKKLLNIFHYSPLHLSTNNFQISHCYQDQEINEVMLIIMADYYKDVLLNFVGFSNSLRNAIAQRAGVSLLHISNLMPSPYKLDATDATKVTFSLLGAARVQGTAQKSITQSKQDLLKAISNGITFHVQYHAHSKDFMVHKSMYVIDYKSSANANSTLVNGSQADGEKSTRKSDSSSVKYSPSTVAGIAIGTLCLGVVIGLGAIFLLHRWKHPGELLFQYKNTTC
uniref:LolA-like domain-containing protein n=1 Tax=Arion vulgaris TaxID=1028688 RepID=A0A0B7AF44_9EUPU